MLEKKYLEVSSSKPLASESKGFAFWVEIVASGLPSAGYLSYVGCELLHRSGGFNLPKGSGCGFPCHQKKKRRLEKSVEWRIQVLSQVDFMPPKFCNL
uniref:Putative ovule protein n=1 Tax=Solanum chacoense TaxID=4108 RepID=A0A0V0H339_SOLCH